MEVIVLDNASGDDTPEAAAPHPWVDVVALRENLGFGRRGFDRADGRAVLALNPDTVLPPGALRACLDELWSHPEVGVLSPRLVDRDGLLDRRCKRGFPTPWSSLCYSPLPPPSGTRVESVLFVGRISPSKGLDDLVKAFGLLRTLHRPAATLDIVGSAAGWERYAAGLEALVHDIGCGGVTFHGAVGDDERDALYARAGVVCLLSRHEGFCVPLVEAMRAVAPVVARDAGAVGETLGDGGLLLPDGDPRLAAEALETVLGDAALRDRLCEGARAALAQLDPIAVEARLRATLGAALDTAEG